MTLHFFYIVKTAMRLAQLALIELESALRFVIYYCFFQLFHDAFVSILCVFRSSKSSNDLDAMLARLELLVNQVVFF